jgi:hypothetical protein
MPMPMSRHHRQEEDKNIYRHTIVICQNKDKNRMETMKHHTGCRTLLCDALDATVLIMSLYLIITISVDTFKGVEFFTQPTFRHSQLIVCLWFLAVFFVEMFAAESRWQYLRTHFIFFFIAIPYQYLIDLFGVKLSDEAVYLIRFIPLIRGGYVLALLVNWITNSRMSGIFFSYLIMLFSAIYFSSLVFYVLEHKVNSLVTAYHDAIWWACMDATTVGSNIVAVTPVGRLLSVILAALGMMMFPIFTAYITSKVKK